MGSRAERRAEARAGRVCKAPGCGKALDARRSTKQYCSDACRMVAYWARGPRPRNGRLCPGQRRILACLSERGLALPREVIAEEARVSPGWLPVYLGHVDPERWLDSSLLRLGYVDAKVISVDGQIRWIYEITPAGREALARCASTAPAPPDGDGAVAGRCR
jgi:hypothetical protein